MSEPVPFAATALPGQVGAAILKAETQRPLNNKEYDSAKEFVDVNSSSDHVGLDHGGEKRIENLARAMSHASKTGEEEPVNPFSDVLDDPELDPNSGKFNPRKWLSNLWQILSRDADKFPTRTAGISWQRLSVFGYSTGADFQPTVSNIWGWESMRNTLGLGRKNRIDILRNFEGLVKSGELLVVLGRPGSGCSTFLKTVAGETHGLFLDGDVDLQYQGISFPEMQGKFKGEVIYQAETETHFPQLSVGETLRFAALARASRNRPGGVSRAVYAEHARDVAMAVFGLTHTMNTKVGNDFIRGVSGGERKRVSIAETTLCGSPIQCWDNSTRGLDSATALEFVKSLRLSTQYSGSTGLVAIYQASQAIYDLFDKVVVLYEGRQIYFGTIHCAKRFFLDMGFDCPPRQTTADFLTSITSPYERILREGFEDRAPRTPDEFAERWRASPERLQLLADIEAYNAEWPVGGAHVERFKESRRAQQSKQQRANSPYTLSYSQQVCLCISRGFQRLKGDFAITGSSIFGNVSLALIVSSVFFNLPNTTSSFFSRGALLFFATLLNAFASALEIFTLWQQRPIVEKHTTYALYHPSAEAFSSMLVDLPSKVFISIPFNLIIYFLTNLRREPGAFFVFFLFSFTTTLTMSHIFRTVGAASRTLSQAMVPTSFFMTALIIYTGFTIPIRDMHVWFRWINYINPIGYAFESLMINEFQNRTFPCSVFVPTGPSYSNAVGQSRSCTVVGGVPGSDFVDGSRYIEVAFGYKTNHLWRNYGIIWGFCILFFFTYILASEKIRAKPSKGEVLVYPKGKIPKYMKKIAKQDDPEPGISEAQRVQSNPQDEASAVIQRQTSIFQWKDVCYDIKIKGQHRRILDHVDGWIQPGQLTALMGVTGAGKTSLLDVLASRVTMGVITGDMLVDGRQRDDSFQRKTGYVQQQDLHLETTTVREALTFSALLRQPKSVPRDEKLAYVEEVIKILEMSDYAEAIVGVPGIGLNVEQRKRLTIGVEMAAKPELLLFFDEPSSGLDSQTAWSICSLMRKLANQGQAILCTIHQPSAMLMQEFDRLLFLAKGGKTVYFGELGDHMDTLIKYFETNGSHTCPPNANPAEWMLEVIGAAPGSHTAIDWHEVWKQGLQNQTFAIFMLLTIFPNICQQIMPYFCAQRSLYEVRERPSKTFSWKAFLLANVIVEIPWNTVMGILVYFCWYYPIGLYKNAEPTGAVHERGALMFLLLWAFMMFATTFTYMVIAAVESAEAGGNIAQLLFSLCLIFCGVLATESSLPGFWVFMYRVSPFTYLVSAVLSTGLANTDVVCSDIEFTSLTPPSGQTCMQYLNDYIDTAGGYLQNPNATSNCQYCTTRTTNAFLSQVNIYYSQRWRNFGIIWAYIVINMIGAFALYWYFRVPKNKRTTKG